MATGKIQATGELSPSRKISYSLALQAEEEMRKNGNVTTLCPKCKNIPCVNIEPARLLVRCSCRYVYNSEIYDWSAFAILIISDFPNTDAYKAKLSWTFSMAEATEPEPRLKIPQKKKSTAKITADNVSRLTGSSGIPEPLAHFLPAAPVCAQNHIAFRHISQSWLLISNNDKTGRVVSCVLSYLFPNTGGHKRQNDLNDLNSARNLLPAHDKKWHFENRSVIRFVMGFCQCWRGKVTKWLKWH